MPFAEGARGARHAASTTPCCGTTRSRLSPLLFAVPDRQSFPEKEEEILKWWEENDTFKESVRLSEGRPPWSFYDGPPFATGLPHYGHILAGTIKVRHRINWHARSSLRLLSFFRRDADRARACAHAGRMW